MGCAAFFSQGASLICHSAYVSVCLRLQGNRKYVRCLYVYNKVDVCTIEEVDAIARQPNSIPVSCSMELNMDALLARIWDMMALVRVYTKKVLGGPTARAARDIFVGLSCWAQRAARSGAASNVVCERSADGYAVPREQRQSGRW
jgi:C-terminal region of MMR_HSR1 domain